ncbi:TrbG/VirB9 family P-type conjugative transfer protein [Novosphingobium sp. SG720]|uniref:TrbG/VirB9 family P-type conjugative transfer protein n=1 Tax=Novosphingobium sp. SG720 TaxID=2586998 RepID=UPI00144779D0|nr:TrbG/VirB9 family P-type conjugative transfer protein [Novosphingobium sp. SG720]NKJ43942.1 type IV secretion system protein VirB9 [Novosphingobium sp. SG720]
MMTAKAFLSSLVTLVLALAPGEARAADARVQHLAFHENQVIAIAARPGYEATIAFADGEQVENIAIGSSAMWQITPNRRADRVFVKPTSARAVATNMTVITDRHTYLFALRVGLAGEPLFLLRFSYPDDPPPQPPATPEAALTTAATDAGMVAAPNPTLDPATLHFGWTMRGARALMPDRVFDDGHAVYLAWPKGRDLPAVLAPAPAGVTAGDGAKARRQAEGPVNYASQGDYLVIDGRHTTLVLRSGKDVAWLERDAPMAEVPTPPLAVASAPAQPQGLPK